MGNCLGGGTGGGGAVVVSNNPTTTMKTAKTNTTKAFQGTGHRLGSARGEPRGQTSSSSSPPPAAGGSKNNNNDDDDVPKPRVDTSLSDSAREQQRIERLRAAEERQKKLGGKPKKPRPVDKNAPLTGPNSKPTMRWTAA